MGARRVPPADNSPLNVLARRHQPQWRAVASFSLLRALQPYRDAAHLHRSPHQGRSLHPIRSAAGLDSDASLSLRVVWFQESTDSLRCDHRSPLQSRFTPRATHCAIFSFH